MTTETERHVDTGTQRHSDTQTCLPRPACLGWAGAMEPAEGKAEEVEAAVELSRLYCLAGSSRPIM